MIQFEKEIIEFLGLPSIPRKEWDKEKAFDKGVAVLELQDGQEAYAVCACTDGKPVVTKVFGFAPFVGIKSIFVVPNYMSTIDDVGKMDLDDKSKKKAESILREAEEVENDSMNEMVESENEYVFDNIHDDEEAVAFITAYNRRNRISGKIPSNHESIVMRLMAISAELNNKEKHGRKKNKANK